MKIIVAPDSFKGSITAVKACDVIERGIRKVFPQAEVVKCPLADGGEGTVDAFAAAASCRIVQIKVTGPLGRRLSARYALTGDGAAVIEMAEASGLMLLQDNERDPMKTTSFGTGELVKDALDKGCSRIIIGLGGSATNDGGAGLAQALGVSLRDAEGCELGFGGGELGRLETIDCSRIDKRLASCEIIAACDVKNPLYGENGASAVFGPQKGADPAMVALLDGNLRHYAEVILRQVGTDVQNIPGTGAAGGIPAALAAFFNAKIQSGIEIILDTVGFDKLLESADLVITGEGRIDFQTAFGKVPAGVAGRAARRGVPVIVFAGSIGNGYKRVYEAGISGIISIMNKPMTLRDAMDNVADLLDDAVERSMKLLAAGMQMGSRQR